MDSALVWFRRDLRCNDHAALHHALAAARRVHCAFVFDTDILLGLSNPADLRVEFIWRSLQELRANLERHGGGLRVLHGRARELIPKLAQDLRIDVVFAARDYESAARARDSAVAAALGRDGRELVLLKDQVIFECDELRNAAGGPFHVFTPYKRAWLARLSDVDLAPYPLDTGGLAGTSSCTDLPLEALGFRPGGLQIEAGESGAQALLARFRPHLADYRETRDYPARDATSGLSVHLRFGTVSIRELARLAWSQGDEGSQTWLSELIWRDFYQMLLWHYPQTTTLAFQGKFSALPWPDPPGHLEAWCEARTGYPLVDAAMRQLNQTGFMHNRLRMIAASFLVKDLHVDWRLGERYFAEKLLDYDQAANVGGWQWSAGVGTDAQPWFRIFNPVTQSQRFDPQGDFIRRYLPELAQVPQSFIHAPWKWSGACRLDYPAPIVDHAQSRLATIALFRGA